MAAGKSKGRPAVGAVVEAPRERRCPVEGCDSIGHMGGNLDRHFTQDACPLYHRKSVAECRVDREERRQKEEDRRRVQQVSI